MDFLDPAKKRVHNIKLLIGYCLMTILVALLTIIIVYGAYGYDIDRKTGEIIQNGLVFLNTQPESAFITINGKLQNDRTDARFSLPAGHYSVELSRDGYGSWRHELDLEGGTIERLNYARIFPTNLSPVEAQVLNETPAFITQTPDKNIMLLHFPAQLNTFHSYNLGTAIGGTIPQASTFNLPAGVLSESPETHKLSSVEWSSDNRHLLLKHDFGPNFEFIVVDRENPAISFNVNKKFNFNPTHTRLLDKRFDQFYVLVGPNGKLQTADSRNGNLSTIAENVTTFKSFGDDALIYSQKDTVADVTKVFIRQDNKAFNLRDLPGHQAPYVDIGRWGNRFYYVVGASLDGKTYIYKDPVGNFFNQNPILKAVPHALLQIDRIDLMEFSPSNRFISVKGGQNIAVYDIELKRKFRFGGKTLVSSGQGTPWMDDHRLLYNAGETAAVVDFDGANERNLITINANLPILFDRDYRWLYSFAPSSTQPTQAALFRTSLRATQ